MVPSAGPDEGEPVESAGAATGSDEREAAEVPTLPQGDGVPAPPVPAASSAGPDEGEPDESADDTLSFYVKARIDPSKRLDPNDYNTILQVSTWGVSVQKVGQMGTRNEIQFWCYTHFCKWHVMKQHYKTALNVQIFSEGNFKKKLEWVFRTPDAEKISTAMEFMSRMLLRRELEGASAAAVVAALKPHAT